MYTFTTIIHVLRILVVSDARIKRRITMDITLLKDIECYRGNRHERCLPFMDSVQELMLEHKGVKELEHFYKIC